MFLCPYQKGISDFIASHLTLFYYLKMIFILRSIFASYGAESEKNFVKASFGISVIGINNNFYREFVDLNGQTRNWSF
jgi:hypothetical protein